MLKTKELWYVLGVFIEELELGTNDQDQRYLRV